MSLVRLLTAGKSFVGLTDYASRYRVTSQRLLPKFDSRKNPFGSAAAQKSAKALEESSGQIPPVAQANTPPATRAELSRPSTPGTVSRWTAWVSKIAQFWPRRLKQLPKAAAPRFTKPMVQPELSLESVTVVRNDLSDSDVEIVPARGAPPLEAPAGCLAAAQPQQPATAWAKATGRLFAATKR